MFKICLGRFAFLGASLTACGIAAADPIALDIDFRDGSIWGGYGTSSFSSDGIAVSAGTGRLYRDNIDGYGILGGEIDEIDRAEVLTVWFSESFSSSGDRLTGALLTDLFPAPDGGSSGEAGWVTLLDAYSHVLATFFVNATIFHPNGEHYVDFGGAYNAARVTFAAYNDPVRGYTGSEFSVAGFTTTSVPEPGTLLLLGSGLLLIGARRARR